MSFPAGRGPTVRQSGYREEKDREVSVVFSGGKSDEAGGRSSTVGVSAHQWTEKKKGGEGGPKLRRRTKVYNSQLEKNRKLKISNEDELQHTVQGDSLPGLGCRSATGQRGGSRGGKSAKREGGRGEEVRFSEKKAKARSLTKPGLGRKCRKKRRGK